MHQKCFSYALTNLFDLCKSVWVIDPLVTHLSPHPRAPERPSTPRVLQARERTPILYPFVVFTFGLIVSPSRSLGVCHSYPSLCATLGIEHHVRDCYVMLGHCCETCRIFVVSLQLSFRYTYQLKVKEVAKRLQGCWISRNIESVWSSFFSTFVMFQLLCV
jgi:hypothetical protein